MEAKESILQQVSALTQLRRYDLALEKLNDLLASYPEDARVFFMIGWVNFQKGDLKRSEAAITKSLSLNPDALGPHNLMGAIHMVRRKLKLSGQCFARALEIQPNNPVVLANLGKVSILEKRYDDAISYSMEGLKHHPNQEDCLNNLFWVYTIQGEKKKAGKFLEENLAQNPENGDTLISLGHSLLQNRQFEESKEVFKGVLAANAEFKPALQGLALVTSHGFWFTRFLTNKVFLMLTYCLAVWGAGLIGMFAMSDDFSFEFLYSILLVLSVISIPFLGTSVGRIHTYITHGTLRQIIGFEKLLGASLIVMLFALKSVTMFVLIQRMFLGHGFNVSLTAFAFCALLIEISLGLRVSSVIRTSLMANITFITMLCLAVITFVLPGNWPYYTCLLFALFFLFDVLFNKPRHVFKIGN